MAHLVSQFMGVIPPRAGVSMSSFINSNSNGAQIILLQTRATDFFQNLLRPLQPLCFRECNGQTKWKSLSALPTL